MVNWYKINGKISFINILDYKSALQNAGVIESELAAYKNAQFNIENANRQHSDEIKSLERAVAQKQQEIDKLEASRGQSQ